MKLRKCYACWSGYGCGEKSKLPRKQKKQFKKIYTDIFPFVYHFFMDGPTSCGLGAFYHHHRGLIAKYPQLKKYLPEIKFIFEVADDQPVYLDENGNLAWYWENDDDFTGGTCGLMKFEYSTAAAGRTWAYSEISTLFGRIGYELDENRDDCLEMPAWIKSDVNLLRYVNELLVTN